MIDTDVLAERRRVEKDKVRARNRAKAAADKVKAAADRGLRLAARQPIGTSVGNKQRMLEFKERLLTAHVGERVIQKTIEVALDDKHPGQMVALKMCMDRVLPVSLFEDRKDGSRTAISITIKGMDEVAVDGGEVIDGDA